MSSAPGLAIATGALADAGLKATGLLAAAWLVNRVGHRWTTAAQRHVVWAATLSTLPLVWVAAAVRGPAVAVDAPAWLGVWAVGVVLSAVGPVRGWLTLRRLRAGAVPAEALPGVGYAHNLDGPITWGVLRPHILLPASALTWTAAEREAALLHERAHVARRDWGVHMWAWCVEALFWFHPLVWHARASLVAEAEHAADDAVLAAGVRASDYATLLLTLGRPSRSRVALGMSRSLLGPRIRAVLEPRPRTTTRAGAVLLACLFVAAAPALVGPAPLWTSTASVTECKPAP